MFKGGHGHLQNNLKSGSSDYLRSGGNPSCSVRNRHWVYFSIAGRTRLYHSATLVIRRSSSPAARTPAIAFHSASQTPPPRPAPHPQPPPVRPPPAHSAVSPRLPRRTRQ